jgi:ABC-type sugar transport system ATPase subunit
MHSIPPTSNAAPLVRLTGITKKFGAVTVLQDVQFECRAHEVHVLAGENGAGKSTLIKILAGLYTDFEGRREIRGRVAVIHQELSLIDAMSVADNIFLGRTPASFGFVRESQQVEAARHWVGQLGLEIDVRQPVENFPVAIRQLIEIAKALSQNARVIVMDEPTSALNAPEVERLFKLIQSLKESGCAIVYITHKMEEIERIAERITVLRDGRWIGSAPASELPPAKLIQWMVGRELGEQFPRRAPPLGQERLRLENFGVGASVKNISFSVSAGEVIGLGGVQGSGASELFFGLFGASGSRTEGSVHLDGNPVRFASPRQAIESGVGFLTNDRKATGLVLSLSVTANATLAGLRELSPFGWRRPALEHAAAEKITGTMRLRAASLEVEVGTLSGGNQQKVALAKWWQTKPRLLLLDEPTRGIDVGAKREIYQLIDEWSAQGIAILLITSEMPELLTLSDRIIVLHRGRITAELSRAQATPEKVLAAAMGRASS